MLQTYRAELKLDVSSSEPPPTKHARTRVPDGLETFGNSLSMHNYFTLISLESFDAARIK